MLLLFAETQTSCGQTITDELESLLQQVVFVQWNEE